MAVVTQLGLQNAYDRAYNACVDALMNDPKNPLSMQDAQVKVENGLLTQGSLRLEILLQQGVTQYDLQVLNNQTNGSVPVRQTEIRLAQQNSFFCHGMRMYIAKAASATATNFSLQTYPNPVTFTGATTLETVYNSYLQVVVNEQKVIVKASTADYRQIPQTQLTGATNSPITEFDPAVTKLLQPNINFVGTNNSIISLFLSGPLDNTLDANTYLVLILDGHLAQNITVLVG